MVALIATLLFTAAFAVSLWAMFITIAPRIDYMRWLLRGDTTPPLSPAVAPRTRCVTRSAAMPVTSRTLRAAA